VSQGVGVATGIQDKFSWKAVGLAAIGGGVSAGIGNVFKGGGWLAAGGRAAAGSAITQGIGVATGLQDKFNWAGVAAAGVGAAVGHAVGGNLPAIGEDNTIGNYAAHAGTSAARLIASAATRSLIDGSSFGDNVLGGLPDIVAQTITDALIHGVTGRRESDGRIGVEAPSGRRNDALADPVIDDPALQVLVDDVKQYNTSRLENRYEDAVADRRKAQRNLNAARRERRELEEQLVQLRTQDQTERSVRRAIRRAENRIERLDERIIPNRQTKFNNRTATEEARALELAPALAANRALQQYFVGKDVVVLNGTLDLDSNGVPEFNGRRPKFDGGSTVGSYTIQGPQARFATADEAAFDAIALARAVSAALNDNPERAGFILERDDGTFTYQADYRLAGIGTVPKVFSLGREFKTSFDAPIPSNVVGIFHTHPVGSDGDENQLNVFFSDADVSAMEQVSNILKRSTPSYLGSADGGVRVIRNPRAYPAGSDAGDVPFADYDLIGPGLLRIR
jgi:hypothetical protein